MRRPTFCGTTTATTTTPTAVTDDTCYCAGGVGDKEEGRLARVKRLLAGTLQSMGRPRGRVFGVRLGELPAGNDDGVPDVAIRLCGYIENYGLRCAGLFRLSAGNPKLVERLRASFDRTGEADLEAAGDPQSVASLLKLWLRELPEPVIAGDVADQLLVVQDKYHDDVSGWRDAASAALGALPDINLRLLHYLLRFMQRCPQPARCRHGALEAAFAPLLLGGAAHSGAVLAAQQLTGKMVREMKHLFHERFVEHAYQTAVGGGWGGGGNASLHGDHGDAMKQQRKRKERHESYNSQSQERKVIRSNSEERPLENNDKDNIRRVSSHEDFSAARTAINKTNNNNNHKNISTGNGGGGFLSELIDPTMGHGVRSNQPLHEHNSPAVSRRALHGAATHSSSEAEDEHERRRSSERFARSMAPRGRRNMARRRRQHKAEVDRQRDADSGSGSSKENEDEGESSNTNPLTPVSSSTSDDDSGREEHKHHAFLQLHPQESERSPSPSSSSPPSPHLDLATLQDLVECNEPLKSRRHYNLAHRHQDGEMSTAGQVVLSPRNSTVFPRRSGLDPNVPPSAPLDHNPRRGVQTAQEVRIKQLQKQITSCKRKLKRYEESFEQEFGYRPSHADKMANRDVKHLGADLIKLRKEMKQLKEDAQVVPVAKPSGLAASSETDLPSVTLKSGKHVTMEELMVEVEQHLSEKRRTAGRPDNVDELNRDQLLDEKVALQKGLLYLESVFGRPATRTERDAVRPLYDKYRALKRLLVRAGASKLKDSVSELATILEHETMDFISQPTSADAKPADAGKPAEPAVTDAASPAQLENLHSLPLSKLLEQQRALREDKKQLRRSLREFEDAFHRRTGKKLQKEDRQPMETTYISYKQAKAKLRLLEALVSKHTSGR